ncbi:hypothetical protein BH11ACT5_BH11ACT5_14090 [soil metagenome]
MATFVASIAEGYRQDASFAHPEGYLALKPEIYVKIAAQLNPGIKWWS